MTCQHKNIINWTVRVGILRNLLTSGASLKQPFKEQWLWHFCIGFISQP